MLGFPLDLSGSIVLEQAQEARFISMTKLVVAVVSWASSHEVYISLLEIQFDPSAKTGSISRLMYRVGQNIII